MILGGALGALVPYWAVDSAVEKIIHPERKPVPRVTSIGDVAARLVALRTSDGLLLRAWYVPSRNGATIILAHGHGENRAQMLPEADFLVRHGFGAFAFDWRAHGGSDGSESTRGDKERRDLEAVLGFLARDPDAASGVLGALGFSRGGNVLVEVAPHEPRIQALVAEAVASSGVESLRQDVGAMKMPFVLWALERRGMDIRSRAPAAAPCERPKPILVVAGENDRSLGGTKRFFERACEPKELWIVPNAGHASFAVATPEEYERRVLAFFDRWLLGERHQPR